MLRNCKAQGGSFGFHVGHNPEPIMTNLIIQMGVTIDWVEIWITILQPIAWFVLGALVSSAIWHSFS